MFYFLTIFIKTFFVRTILQTVISMKKFLSLSIIFLSVISCAKKKQDQFQVPTTMTDTMQITDTVQRTYLALGDSYTIGSSVSQAERFPVQATQLLRQQNIDAIDPEIIAVNGWTTLNLLSSLRSSPPQKKTYTFVTLLIGVNNQYQGGSLEEYKSDFAKLLAMAISYAGDITSHVFVLSIPDYSVTPFAHGSNTAKIATEINAFNAANKSISLNAGARYIDVTGISREAKNDPSLIAGDGLHPSGLQYKRWCELLVPAMLNEIR